MFITRSVFTFLLFALVSTAATAQHVQYVDLTHSSENLEPVAAPPIEAMKPFKKLLGTYDGEGLMTGLSYKGNMTIEPVMKGWYIKWTYDLVASIDGEVGAQHISYMIGWDRNQEKYQIVRFGTESEVVMETGSAYFEDENTLIMELNMITPNGKPGVMRNRIDVSNPDRIEVITEGEEEGTPSVVRLGVGAFQRTL